MENGFQCVVLTPEQQVLDQRASYVLLPAWDGYMGLAKGHAPLMVKLGDGVLRLDSGEGEGRSFFVGGGFANMLGDRLIILADEAVAATDIDVENARASLAEVQGAVAVGDQAAQERDRKANRARQMLRAAGAQ